MRREVGFLKPSGGCKESRQLSGMAYFWVSSLYMALILVNLIVLGLERVIVLFGKKLLWAGGFPSK